MRIDWIRRGVVAAGVLGLAAGSAAAEPPAPGEAARIRALGAMMADMAPESRRAASAIRAAYRDELSRSLRDRRALIRALETGAVARLPEAPWRYNVFPRLAGASPIAERDVVYQPLYLAARPAALGALLTVASRVTSGPVEVTSLVRHREYQHALRRTNPNAATDVPTHTMGLAFDISVLHASVETAAEIRDVLRAMSRAGDLFVVAETHQLVFHVLPTPGRLAFFEAIYEAVLALTPGSSPAVVAAKAPSPAGRPAAAAGAMDAM